mgnify:CR=1 FL=1
MVQTTHDLSFSLCNDTQGKEFAQTFHFALGSQERRREMVEALSVHHNQQKDFEDSPHVDYMLIIII